MSKRHVISVKQIETYIQSTFKEVASDGSKSLHVRLDGKEFSVILAPAHYKKTGITSTFTSLKDAVNYYNSLL